MTKHETMIDTYKHKQLVHQFLSVLITKLLARGITHDNSKLEDFEAETFAEYTSKLASSTYGSEEYKTFLKEMKPALDHHYAVNPHHPEHYPCGIRDMTLIDLMEMICDWKASTLRHNDGNILISIDKNQERFGYSQELVQILKNTVKLFE
jgi:hypothetical protein